MGGQHRKQVVSSKGVHRHRLCSLTALLDSDNEPLEGGVEMPIYEFRCTNCGRIREFLIISSNDTVEIRCDECGSEQMERVVSRTSHFVKPSSGEGPSVTTRSCSPGSSCATLTLPGYER